jgi:NMD protein affecting ribosome stability and mRNA decay
MIKYNERFYKCFPHDLKFVSYCKSCNINLCQKCEEKHTGKEHTRISYKAIMPNPKKLIEINDEIKEVKEKLNRYKFEINRLNNLYITNMNNVIDDINKYILLYNKYYIF